MSNPIGDDLMTIREVCQFFGTTDRALDQSTIYRWIRRGTIPRPIRLSAGMQRWRRADIQKVWDDMVAAANQQVQP